MLRRYLLSIAVVGCFAGAATPTQAAPVQPGAQLSAPATQTVEKAAYRYSNRHYHRRHRYRHRRHRRY